MNIMIRCIGRCPARRITTCFLIVAHIVHFLETRFTKVFDVCQFRKKLVFRNIPVYANQYKRRNH